MDHILFGLAVLPAFLLMIYISKKDRIEKEPKRLIVSLFVLGALSTVGAVIIGLLGESLVLEFLDEDSLLYTFINAFFLVALVEEGGKFVMLKLRTWNNREFNYTFDAVVYAVSVSLGFATLENILYVIPGGIGTAVLRGILSVPGHAINAVFMGYFYGLAKRCQYLGDNTGKNLNLLKAWLSASMIHGFYDFCLMSGEDYLLAAFLIFEVVITVLAVKKVNKLSREDSPIGPPIGIPFTSYGGYFQQNPYYYDPRGYYTSYNNSYNNYQQQYTQNSYNGYYADQNYGYQYNGRYQQAKFDPYTGEPIDQNMYDPAGYDTNGYHNSYQGYNNYSNNYSGYNNGYTYSGQQQNGFYRGNDQNNYRQ